MMENGTFTNIYYPNNEKLFENASIDILIFRYCKNKKLKKMCIFNNQKKHIINTNGILTFSEQKNNNNELISDYFDIYVGMVSAKDSVFKNDIYGNIDMLSGNNKFSKYIFIENYPTENNDLNNYLEDNKKELINRKIRKFNEDNWWQLGAPRNIETIKNNIDKECIYNIIYEK
jgi:adenine-specific DNA-methyltransferase